MKNRVQNPGSSSMASQRGFSLTELLIVVAISSMIFYGIASVMRSGSSHAQGIGVQTHIQSTAQAGLTHMLQELRESAPDRITIAGTTLLFQIPASINNAGIITWTGTIQYDLNGLNNSQLRRTDPNGAVRIIANDVQGITYTVDDAGDPRRVNVQLTLTRQTAQGRAYTEIISGEAMIRNE